VRCLKQAGETGFCGAWNEGLAAARGELFAFLDSDDRWAPDKLELQTALLLRRPEVDIALGRVRFFLEPGMVAPPGFRTRLLEGEHVAPMPGALLAPRSVLETVGDFDTSFGLSSDIEWFARVKDAGLVVEPVPALVIHKRVHDHNLSLSSVREYNEQTLRLVRQSALRMRSGA
jgi:glycosyltransferase involved in cell wall biosynthesis